MRCVRCRGWLVGEVVETLEGTLFMMRCILCGERYEAIVNQHRAHPVPPYAEPKRRPYESRTRRR